MATSKTKTSEKTTGKTKRTATPSKSAKTKAAKVIKKAPTEDEIRAKAQEIYTERLNSGETGSAEGDWTKAERLLTAKRK
jgi:hypothetical protein